MTGTNRGLKVSENDDPTPSQAERAEPLVAIPVNHRTGPGLALTALVLPVIAGISLCFVSSLIVVIAIAGGMVILTAILLSVDAYRLGAIDRAGKRRENPLLLFAAMILIWILGYPITYFRRRHFAGPPLGLLSIAVALFYVAAPVTHAILASPEPPSCTSSAVTNIVERLIMGASPGGDFAVRSVDSFREIGFDRDANRRTGECTVHMRFDESAARYVVEWDGNSRRDFVVRILPSDLPTCTSSVVTRMLEQGIRAHPMWSKTKSITDHREISFAPDGSRRIGECTLHVDGLEISVNFHVEFQNRAQGLYGVRIFPNEPPSCVNAEVLRLVEQIIRQGPIGPAVKSISGHREIRYDRPAGRRLGQCIVTTTTGNVTLKYTVDNVKDKGEVHVNIVAEQSNTG